MNTIQPLSEIAQIELVYKPEDDLNSAPNRVWYAEKTFEGFTMEPCP
ncbi:hypothetical protein [Algoriphagus hitonicola]|uniref:Uncharacterized protein n=1 Tax=Algoriphagus hitonicola TaxID=435880 RepID=A0A1I2XHB8_9BACT|nr:hypothetical protein [Algoriphagus hitonicola]SFH12894.1 hypothetical protein SAMN04487988_1196 [Algoriphagus hitonicola]